MLLAVPACGNEARHAGPQRYEVEVTGDHYQWHIRHPGNDGRLQTPDDTFALRHLDLPAERDVTIHLRSKDFVYTFALPDFEQNEIAVPAMAFSVSFRTGPPGDFELRGDELCGLDHPDLSGRVRVRAATGSGTGLALVTGERTPTGGNR